MPRSSLHVQPLTAERWPDIEDLFGPRGACAGCWCMYWRRQAAEFDRGKGEGNRRAFRGVVQSGEIPGLIAYDGDEPVGWCALAPRERYPRLANSRILAPIDDRPVWSLSCLFVKRGHRRKGVSRRLIRAAVKYARSRGATVVEAYPVEPANDRVADAFVWTGLASAYLAEGFHEVARRSATRPIVRRSLRPPR